MLAETYLCKMLGAESHTLHRSGTYDDRFDCVARDYEVRIIRSDDLVILAQIC